MPCDLPDGWRETTLATLEAPNGLVGGPFGSSLGRSDYVSDGIPVIRGSNLAGPGRFNMDGLVFVGPEKFEGDLKRNQAAPGDIVLTQRGTLGQVGVIPEVFPLWVVSQSQMRLRVDDGVASRDFVFYVLKSPALRDQISQRAIATGVPHINLGIARELAVPLPPLPEQHRIAVILRTLDDKIDSNRQLAALLEQIAQAEFQARFIDFVGAEELLDVRGLKVPSGWRVARIDELSEINAASHTATDHPPVLEYVDISAVSARSVKQTRRLSFDDAPSRARRKVRTGDTLVSTVRPERRAIAFLHEASPEMTASTGFAVVTPTTGPPTFVYRAVTSDTCINHLSQSASGSAYPAVNPSVLAAWRIGCPPDNGRAYEEFARPLEALRHGLLREAATLAAIRDALLPKLVSGQIRVPDTADPEEVKGPVAEEVVV